jgi:plasmid stabilization system protein ParE
VNSKPVFAVEAVESDLREAISHYLGWRPDGKEHVLGLYDETVSWIAWNPDLFPKKFGSIQRAILKRTFYVVYFLQEHDRTIILAVLDARRGPIAIRSLVAQRRRRKRHR